MHTVNVESELEYNIASPTSFVFNIAPAFTQHQMISNENLLVSPDTYVEWCMLNQLGVRGIWMVVIIVFSQSATGCLIISTTSPVVLMHPPVLAMY
jgi:hypothetical protein